MGGPGSLHLDLSEVGSLGFLRPLGKEIYWAFLAQVKYSIEEIESMGKKTFFFFL